MLRYPYRSTVSLKGQPTSVSPAASFASYLVRGRHHERRGGTLALPARRTTLILPAAPCIKLILCTYVRRRWLLLVVFAKDDPAGKQELYEVVENLRHWKENCAALGYDSDGEQLSEEATQGSAEGVDVDGAAGSERKEKEVGQNRRYSPIRVQLLTQET